jgi:hypothetical protein
MRISISISDEPLLSLEKRWSKPYPVLISKRITNKAAMPGGDSMAAREASMADFVWESGAIMML